MRQFSEDAYQLCSDLEFSFEQKHFILKMQEEQLTKLLQVPDNTERTNSMIKLLFDEVVDKIKFFEKAIVDEKRYYNTMPQSIYHQKKALEKLNRERLLKFE